MLLPLTRELHTHWISLYDFGKDNQGHHWVEKISEISKIVAKDTGMISTADIFEHVNGGFRNMLNQMSDEKRREMGYM